MISTVQDAICRDVVIARSKENKIYAVLRAIRPALDMI